MKLIILTTPYFFVEEHQILTALFDEGLDILHLRKPGTEPVYSERLLSLIPEGYRKQIVVHDHFYLKAEYNLKGIHLNSRNAAPPEGYKGQMSCSCHSAEEVEAGKKNCDYVFLSPVFDSISKANYKAGFTPDQLRQLSRQRVIDRKVMALGGVSADNAGQLKDYGFGGCVVLGALWSRFNVYQTQDFKDLLTYFRRLKKVVG